MSLSRKWLLLLVLPCLWQTARHAGDASLRDWQSTVEWLFLIVSFALLPSYREPGRVWLFTWYTLWLGFGSLTYVVSEPTGEALARIAVRLVVTGLVVGLSQPGQKTI